MSQIGIPRRAALAAMGTFGAAALVVAAAEEWQPEERAQDGLRHGQEAPQPRGLGPQELGWDAEGNQYILPQLPYDAAALEPHIDQQTMELHHGQHHRAYVAGLNRALRNLWEIREGSADPNLTQHWLRQVSFHGSGHFNHALFWQILAPAGQGGGGQPQGDLVRTIARDFGSFSQFSDQFKQAARGVEGGGWAWLAVDAMSSRLLIVQMESQQHSVLNGMTPLMGIDVWEHAYYLRYQNRRGEYVDAFMNVINWPRVEELFGMATGAAAAGPPPGPER
jgi:superoxide dismutase, Fe-Mn family